MNSQSLPPGDRFRTSRRAFTLIELLTVIAIILVLAGLLIHIAGSANYRSSVARANTEVQAMSTALESYKADNGAYPRTTPAGSGSDALNAQTDTDPGGSASSKYQLAGQLLFTALSGTTFTGGTVSYVKPYMSFRPGQLSSGNAAFTSATVPYLLDPFGLAYGYSTANQYAQDTANASTPPAAVDNTKGYNPTFDLWSTAGYGSGGKSYAGTGVASTAYQTLWAKNLVTSAVSGGRLFADRTFRPQVRYV